MRKPPPILDGLAAADDHVAPGGQRGQPQEQRGGVVVDGEAGLGAGDRLDQGAEVVEARAALAGGEVVLQVGEAAAGGVHGGAGGVGEGGAAEVGVQDHAGSVDYGSQGGAVQRLDAVDKRLGELVEVGAGGGVGVAQLGAGALEDGARVLGQAAVGVAAAQGRDGRVLEDPVDAW